jgi:glycerophosphoryl diester phosphodiesterase
MKKQVEVIGHRGARGLFPENTLEGFRRAWDLGVRTFELDTGMTADGVIVVSHDPALNPDITRDAEGKFLTRPTPLIQDLTFDELCTYDVGRIRSSSLYRLAHRGQKPVDGTRIPPLSEVLALLPDATFIIELKTDPRHPERTVSPLIMAAAVLAVIDAAKAAGRVILESFDWRGPRYVRRVRPDIRTAWLTRSETIRDAALWWDGETPEAHAGSIPATIASQGGVPGDRELAAGQSGTGQSARGQSGSGQIWAPQFTTLTRAAIAEAHDLGLLVVPWTVNRRAAMRRLIGWGVDGLITDRADVALAMTVPQSV